MFPEFYRPGPDDERRFVTEGTVVVDTNVLLGLYEFSSDQRGEALAVLESISERLWIPHRVALEYQAGRLRVIRTQAGHYNSLVNLVGPWTADDLAKSMDRLAIPQEVADEVRPMLADLATRLTEPTADYASAVEAIRDRHVVTPEQGLAADPVREHLDRVFDGRVGTGPSEEERAARIEEAKRRGEEKIPPGYKDIDKADAEQRAGDYLLWAELLEHAEASKEDERPFLFVTNDVKEDWYEKADGGPRRELVREFLGRNPNGYHQVTLGALLRLAKEHLDADVDDATIEKASELSRPRPDAYFPAYDIAMTRQLLAQGIPVDEVRRMVDTARDGLDDATWDDLQGALNQDQESVRRVLAEGAAAQKALANDAAAQRVLAAAAQMSRADYAAAQKAYEQADPETLAAARRILNDPAMQRSIRNYIRHNPTPRWQDDPSDTDES